MEFTREFVVPHTRRCIGRLYFSLPPSTSRFEILPRPASQTPRLRSARGSLTISSSLVIEAGVSPGRGISLLPFNQSSLRALKYDTPGSTCVAARWASISPKSALKRCG